MRRAYRTSTFPKPRADSSLGQIRAWRALADLRCWRIGAGTQVSPHATAISKDVARAARKLIDTCKRENLELSEVLQVIHATW